ncbi:hypothetical protein [Laspinema olomoucense]|uniref:hypothetical protein n=1 Tax=Laspinema olomoucense TaxID=3231600 RepID=UPI0021BA8B13|nr:hypothetical protein [Laspinema sp. D3c]MCT7995237.1 hypothetical protein [Laspinema sp. D3c]
MNRADPEKNNTMRVLHCPNIIGGNPQGLARAEREIGIKSWSVAERQNYFNYLADEILVTEKDSPLLLEWKRWRMLWRAINEFDVIHFNWGQSIMPHKLLSGSKTARQYPKVIQSLYGFYSQFFELKDLPLLKKAGKGIVVTYQGDDIRQGDVSQAKFEINFANEVDPGYYSEESDSHKRHRLAIFAQYADRIFATTPDLLNFLPPQSQILPKCHIDLREWLPINQENSLSKVPLIIHAPSHRQVKGTRFIVDVISRLKSDGVSLEFLLVEGVSHAEARKLYEKSDILIDQLLAGWYGGLAVELMALGKPVICYLREGDLKFLPAQMSKDLPIINATSITLYEVLKQLLTVRKHELPEIGRKSRAYVERWHDPLKIAERMKKEYESILLSKRK